MFIYQLLRRVPFLQNADKGELYEIMYSLTEVFIEAGEYIAKKQTPVDKIIFIERGEVEMMTVFEGNEFVYAKRIQNVKVRYWSNISLQFIPTARHGSH